MSDVGKGVILIFCLVVFIIGLINVYGGYILAGRIRALWIGLFNIAESIVIAFFVWKL